MRLVYLAQLSDLKQIKNTSRPTLPRRRLEELRGDSVRLNVGCEQKGVTLPRKAYKHLDDIFDVAHIQRSFGRFAEETRWLSVVLGREVNEG